MSGRTFWILSFVLVAVASHLAFVLFGPRFESQEIYKELVAVTGTNKLQALSPQQARRLSATSDSNLVHAVCAFDLSRGPVKLAAKLPETYWSINIYSLKGDVIYTLNDRQADTRELFIVLTLGGDETDQPNEEEVLKPPTSFNDIQVVAPAPKGLAVLRSLIMHEYQRKRLADTLNQSSCAAGTG